MYKYLRCGFIILFCLLIIIIQFTYCTLLNEADKSGDEDNLLWIEWNNSGIDATVYFVSINGNDMMGKINNKYLGP